MLITSIILLLLLPNAVTLRRDKSVLFSRVALLVVLCCSNVALNSLFIMPLERGIGLFGGLYHATCTTQIFQIFIFIISFATISLFATTSHPPAIKKDFLDNNRYYIVKIFMEIKFKIIMSLRGFKDIKYKYYITCFILFMTYIAINIISMVVSKNFSGFFGLLIYIFTIISYHLLFLILSFNLDKPKTSILDQLKKGIKTFFYHFKLTIAILITVFLVLFSFRWLISAGLNLDNLKSTEFFYNRLIFLYNYL